MYLALTDEQRFLREAAADALGRHATLEAARAALDGEPVEDLWGTAVEAGWSGLLVSEAADGAGLGAYEALLVLEACGRVLADARMLGHLPATALLDAAAFDSEALAALARGERRAALVDARLSERDAQIQAGDDGTLRGTVRGVLDADGADVLVVAARTPDGDAAAFVVNPRDDGVALEPERAYDATRALATVRLDGARGERLDLPPDRVGDGCDLQRALLAAEAVGAADGALTMARDYAVDRKAFGRAIGSFQAIKHKLVEMLRRVELGRSLLVHAGQAWESDRPGFALAANAARVVAGDALDYAAPENIFIHGGIGATWEHDAQLFYRRAELTRRLAGGSDAAALALADALLAAAPADVEREAVAVSAAGAS